MTRPARVYDAHETTRAAALALDFVLAGHPFLVLVNPAGNEASPE